jgi:organic radical activating enzyme
MTLPTLPFVEIMITQACNLSCQGCTNYSDIPQRGYVTWSQGQEWFNQWRQRLTLPDIGIMGGEPLINPEWREWLRGLREMFPDSQLRFTTNGLLLAKHPDIMDMMFDIGNVVFKITVHVQNTELHDWIQSCFDQHDWQLVSEFGINRWRGRNQVRFQLNQPQRFNRPFRGSYEDMQPWNSDPYDAFAQCIQQTCPLLYQGRIYKCSTTALLADTLQRFGRPNWPQWQPYLTTGIGHNDDDKIVNTFLNNFGKPESVCAQCPGRDSPMFDHRATVSWGKK